MKRFNIVIPKKYTKNGQENTQWNIVGTLVKFEATPERPEGYILELSMFPNTTFKVFEQKPKAVEDISQEVSNIDIAENLPF